MTGTKSAFDAAAAARSLRAEGDPLAKRPRLPAAIDPAAALAQPCGSLFKSVAVLRRFGLTDFEAEIAMKSASL